jgi:hypothetical protein
MASGERAGTGEGVVGSVEVVLHAVAVCVTIEIIDHGATRKNGGRSRRGTAGSLSSLADPWLAAHSGV